MATVPLLSDEAAPEASRVTLDAIRAAQIETARYERSAGCFDRLSRRCSD